MSHIQNDLSCTAFAGPTRIASGPVIDVAVAVRAHLDNQPDAAVLIFNDADQHQVELDLRGSIADVRDRIAAASTEPETPPTPAPLPRGRGRPKLGVVAREVTLLPRHWEWLKSQPGSASVTLRKLIEKERRQGAGADRARRAQEVAYRFMSVMAGDQPGFEDATRALFASDAEMFEKNAAAWPRDVRDRAQSLAHLAFSAVQDSVEVV